MRGRTTAADAARVCQYLYVCAGAPDAVSARLCADALRGNISALLTLHVRQYLYVFFFWLCADALRGNISALLTLHVCQYLYVCTGAPDARVSVLQVCQYYY